LQARRTRELRDGSARELRDGRHLAEQRRLAEERRLADEEAERIWQANAPRRQAALDAIPEAEAAFAVIGAEYYEAEKRLGELRKAASE
jgi:hypothetical protein